MMNESSTPNDRTSAFLELLEAAKVKDADRGPNFEERVRRLSRAYMASSEGELDLYGVLFDEDIDDEMPDDYTEPDRSWIEDFNRDEAKRSEGELAISSSLSSDRMESSVPSEGDTVVAGRVTVHDRDTMASLVEAGLVVAVPEFADDQAVPREDLDRFFRNGVARTSAAAQQILTPWIQREFRRALINGELLPLNRAYLVNNAALFSMYQHDDADREGMIALLSRGAIAPFLLKETDPLAAPLGLRMNEAGVDAWLTVSRAARDSGGITAIRLAHDDATNDRLLNELLVQRFQALASTLGARNLMRLRDDLGLEPVLGADVRPLLRFFTVTQALAADLAERRYSPAGIPGSISRTDFYLAFVSSVPEAGLYDGGALIQDPKRVLADRDWGDDWIPQFQKLHEQFPVDVRRACARGLKELIDLVYNTNLPDALGGYGLTPQGALPRTALQELSLARQQPGGLDRLGAQEILAMVQRKAFSQIMEQLAAPEIASLSLSQIAEVRETDVWKAYIASLRNLLRAPANFEAEASAVYESYLEMVQTAVPKTRAPKTVKPSPKLLVQIDAATIELMWTENGVVGEQRGQVSPAASLDRSQISLQFGIGDRRSGADQTGWTTMTEFYRGAIANPAGAVSTIVEELGKRGEFQWVNLVDTVQPSTLDHK